MKATFSKRHRRTFIKAGKRHDYFSSTPNSPGANLVVTNLFTGKEEKAKYALVPSEALPETRAPHNSESQ